MGKQKYSKFLANMEVKDLVLAIIKQNRAARQFKGRGTALKHQYF